MRRIGLGLAVLFIAVAVGATAGAREVKEKIKVTDKGDTVMGKSITKYEDGVLTDQGYLIKDVVKFKEMKKGDDWVYVTKGKETYRLKFAGDDIKKNMLKVDKEKPIVIYSTHPLTAKEWSMYNTLHLLEQ